MSEIGSTRNRTTSKLNTTNIVKLFILHFLVNEKSCYGTELLDKIERSLSYNWRPSNGLIYPLLRDMEQNLWIEGWWDEPDKKNKKHYKVTDEGIKHYNKIKLIYKPLLDESLMFTKATLEEIYKL